MKTILCRLSFLMAFILNMAMGAAQSNFLYIQSENNQPYFVQMKGTVYSSNAKGYLLIPQMANGDYSLVLGFPVKEYKESTFSFSIMGKPRGFSLKITQEGEWMLMDMVTLELLKGAAPDNPIALQKGELQIQKLSERNTEVGLEMVYRVRNGTKTENISIQIPTAKVGATREAIVSPVLKEAQKKTVKQ